VLAVKPAAEVVHDDLGTFRGEEERVLAVFSNSVEPRELRIPLSNTPAEGAAGFRQILGQAKAAVFKGEARITAPAQSISIFLVD